MEVEELGPAARTGKSFQARAETRQREYRTRVLGAGWSKYGHLLDDEAERRGCNFVAPAAHAAARARAASGKGVTDRTFRNMLSSQAMCFNVFAPLARDLDLAGEVVSAVLPVRRVKSLAFEYTPPAETFRDQRGQSGVDCDLLLKAEWQDGTAGLVAIETKFVEEEFSSCGFRASGRAAKGRPVCADDVPVRDQPGACLYGSRKGYLYWERTIQLGTIRAGALPATGCPYGGPQWQLWVNHTLVHALAERQGLGHALFAVCAPAGNERLLRDDVLGSFSSRLSRPETFAFLSLDTLLERISDAVSGRSRELQDWAAALQQRYGRI